MHLPIKHIPKEIINHYNLSKLITNDKIYIKISKGMYGLKQAGILAFEQLKCHLAPFGYFPVRHTPGLWRHISNSVIFTLVVNDFRIKYTNEDDVNQFLKSLSSKYNITID